MGYHKGEKPVIRVDLTQYPEVFQAIQDAARNMEWTPSTLLRRNLVAAFNAGADFKNALANLGTAVKRPWLTDDGEKL